MAVLKIDLQVNDGGAEATLSRVETGLQKIGAASSEAGQKLARSFTDLRERADALSKTFAERAASPQAYFRALDTELVRVGSSMQATGREVSSIGRSFSAGLTAPLVGAAAALIKIGNAFDNASDSIRAATGATGTQLDRLNNSFKTVLASVPASMQDVATAIGDLNTRTGLTGAALEGLASQMLNLSRLSGSDIAPLIRETTRLFGDWSVSTADQAAALDFLFRTSQSTGIGVSQLSNTMVQFGAPLRALGFEFEQSAALIGLWEKEGVNLETVLAGMKMGLKNFAKAGEEPAVALQNVILAIQNAGSSAEANSIAFQAFGQRAGIDMSRAIQEGRFNIDALVNSLKTSKETINGAALATMSLGERMQLLGNRVALAAEPLATKFVTGLEHLAIAAMPVVNFLGRVAGWFSGLPAPIQTGAIAIAGFATALGPMIWAFGNLLTFGGGVLKFLGGMGIMSSIGPMAMSARAGMAAFTASLATGPFIAVAGALAGIVFGMDKVVGAWKNAKAAYDRGGWKAVAGELGRNVHNDDLSLFRDWRVTQPSDRRRGGAASNAPALEIAPGFLAGGARAAALRDEALNQQRILELGGSPGGGSGGSGGGAPARVNQFGGADRFKTAREAMADLKAIGGLTRLTEDETTRLNRTLGDAIEKYQALGQTAPISMLRTWMATHALRVEPLTQLPGVDIGMPQIPKAPMVPVPSIGLEPLTQLPGVDVGMPQIPQAPKGPGFFESAFGGSKDFGANLSNVILQAFTGGGDLGKSIGGFLGGGLFDSLGGKLAGMLGEKGLGGMLGGALTGIMGPLGTMLGSLAGKLLGKLGGLFGIGNAGRDLVKDFAADHGGFDSLHDKLGAMGEKGEELWIKLTQGVGRNNPEQAKKVIEEVGAALDAWPEQKMRAVADIVSGVNARSQNITSQSDMDVVSAGAVSAFGAQLGQGTGALEAFGEITGAITAMRDAMAGGNFELSAAGQRLLDLGLTIETNKVHFQNLAADGQILQGMMQGNIRDFDLFRAVTADIGVQLQGMIDKGVPTAEVFALAQPQLQAIWEAQQKWHYEVDATTQSLIDQAVQQGLVGEHVKSVHEQILSVLIAIGDALGAQIPAALGGLPGAAQQAADGMNAAFDTVRVPTVDLGEFHTELPEGADPNAPKYHSGGLVGWRRMHSGGLAGDEVPIIGQRGEYMVSRRGVAFLDSINRGQMPGGGGNMTVIIQRPDGSTEAEYLMPYIANEVRRIGLMRS